MYYSFVILVSGILAFIVRKFNSIPRLIKETGKKTLMLYIVHVVILYGSAWFPGLYRYLNKSFNSVETIIATLIMLGLMLGLVVLSDKVKYFKNRKIALNKV